MRTFFVIALLSLPALAEPPQPPPRPSQETVKGPLENAYKDFSFWNRGADMQRENFGLNGRKNATNQAAEDAELPRAVQRGGSPWIGW